MPKNSPRKAIVYALTNPCMPDLVKIGLTKKSVKQRIRSLDTTAVPEPFQFLYAVAVEDAEKVERLLHRGLKGLLDTKNYRKEFYRITPESARSLLKVIEVLGGEEVDADYDPRLPSAPKPPAPKDDKPVTSNQEKQLVDKLDVSVRPVWFKLREELSKFPHTDLHVRQKSKDISFRRQGGRKRGEAVCFICFRKTRIRIHILRGMLYSDGRRSARFFTMNDPKKFCEEVKHTATQHMYRCYISDAKDLDYVVWLLKQKYDHIK